MICVDKGKEDQKSDIVIVYMQIDRRSPLGRVKIRTAYGRKGRWYVSYPVHINNITH
jgi:hypothetical protein